MSTKPSVGHILALITAFIWGTTFIATKILLVEFTPVEILFIRFVLGFIALSLACPRRLKLAEKKQEWLFVLAGLTGVCLYYLMENIALTYTMASNVGVLVSISPFITALLAFALSRRKEKLRASFVLGFIVAITGICLISFNGAQLELNPLGDVLALGATLVWAIYSVTVNKISTFGYNVIQTTRRFFLYGLIFMIPAIFAMDFSPNWSCLAEPKYLLMFLFLGIGACAVCFVTWNISIQVLGPVKCSIYLYLVPVITVVASAIVLREQITPLAILGTALTLLGLILSSDLKRK
ncbi:MAG: DMT family transporter [Clostridiales bacterium]|nr:DMT family transporter [Clostridiales bacterium]